MSKKVKVNKKNDAKVKEIRRYFEIRPNVDQPKPNLVKNSDHLPSQELVLTGQLAQNLTSVTGSRKGDVQGGICIENETKMGIQPKLTPLRKLPMIGDKLPLEKSLNGKRKSNSIQNEIEPLNLKYLKLDTAHAQ